MTLNTAWSSPDAAAPEGGKESGLRLAEIYHRSFEWVLATTDELREESYRLRYQVYCIENEFEDPAENPNGLETDRYDANAAHALLRHLPSGRFAGTVRLILPSKEYPERSFPLQELCDDPIISDPDLFPVHQTAEISRFSISKQFMRRANDDSYRGVGRSETPNNERRLIPSISLGLIEALVAMSAQHGITHWCAEMEPYLLKRLTRFGIHFDPIGPIIEHHGRRQPCYKRLDLLLARVREEKPEIWELLTNDGVYSQVA